MYPPPLLLNPVAPVIGYVSNAERLSAALCICTCKCSGHLALQGPRREWRERWEKKIENKGAGMPLEAVNLRKYVGHVSPMNSAAGRKSNKNTRETQILFELTIRIWYDHRLDCKIPGTLNQQKPPNLPFGIHAVSRSRGAASTSARCREDLQYFRLWITGFDQFKLFIASCEK